MQQTTGTELVVSTYELFCVATFLGAYVYFIMKISSVHTPVTLPYIFARAIAGL